MLKRGRSITFTHVHYPIVSCGTYFGFGFNTSSDTIEILAERAFKTVTFEMTEISPLQLFCAIKA